MKPMAALNAFFNKDEHGQKIKSIGDFKAELDELSLEEKNELGALACEQLGTEFEPGE